MASMERTLPDDSLRRLASAADVVIDWVDAWGKPQTVPDENLIGVLEALTGRDLDSRAAIERATSDILADRAVVDPVIVAWDGRMPSVEVSVSVRDAVLVLEDGSERVLAIDGSTINATKGVPTGYHLLVLDDGAYTSHVFSAPSRAHSAPRGALGLISPTYSLRRDGHDVGIGTLADFGALADLCDAHGIAVVGTLPLLAAFPDQPSPYAPASRRAWNELFVDTDTVPGGTLDPVVGSDDPAWVDYEAVGMAIRAEIARYAEHVSSTPKLRTMVDEYLAREPEMRSYARFRAMADAHGRNWRAWPASVHAEPARVAYHETAQWLMDRQLRELSSTMSARGQYLYLDLPIGCHPDGYDIWDHPELFAPASLGAPPDTLFVGGQDWGLPASIPKRSREEGHANFRKAIHRQLTVAGLLRIDHVMGIHRTWWVPHGAGATNGAYVMQPTDEMFAIICIESVRAGSGVVGENLGTVPPEIRTALDDHELLGMAMATDGVSVPRENDLVALSSHDTPAFAAWWKANDVEDLHDLGVFDDERAAAERDARRELVDGLSDLFGTEGADATRDALIEWMASTPAAVALVNLDDLLMEERRQNIPGTDWERPNWRLRHSVTIDEMAADPRLTSRLDRFVAHRDPTGS
jgi:4-alpha-glucanotransferase